MKNLTLTDADRWQAVLARDPAADGQFVFAVRTTGIFCRPSCRARHAQRENVCFYADAREAQRAGYRPCKRCLPDREAPQAHRMAQIEKACRLLEEQPDMTLAALASEMATSPYHFHRLFKGATGMTPKAWQQAARAKRLRQALEQGAAVTDSVLAAGFPDSSSYYRKANDALGMTATQYRNGGEALKIDYATGDGSLGRYLVAQSERGVCAILLGDDDCALTQELQRLFPRAELRALQGESAGQIREAIARLDRTGAPLALPLDIRGTAFQQQVWQALRNIPRGETASYQQVAQAVGRPRAVRAVAAACAANRLAIIIPCHRVVRSDGAPGGYRWGSARKALLLRRELTEEE